MYVILVQSADTGENEGTSLLQLEIWETEEIAELNSQSIWINIFIIKEFDFKVKGIFSLNWLSGSCVFWLLKINSQKHKHVFRYINMQA